MDFRILGPLEVLDEDRLVVLAGNRQRALLALFLLHAGETLTTERLIEELWGERQPSAVAGKTVQVQISRLRKALRASAGGSSDDLLVTRESGYELQLDPECVDAHRFEALFAEGRNELTTGRPEAAATSMEGALSLWRGPLLVEFAYESFAQSEIARFDDLHVAALEQLVEAKLALGRHAEVVGQLEALIAEHPYREGLRAQQMLALYRCDRQADALQAFQNARRTLVEELGIEPGERLRELERAVLAQDPELAAPKPPQLPPVDAPRVRLPAAPTPTIGRDAEVEAVSELLRGGTRLVTLTGPGGVGKTRLALEVGSVLAPALRDGVWFVSLASIASPDHVPSAVIQALGVTPLQGETPKTAAERFLSGKRGVLVLDNFEHVLPAAHVVGDILRGCPGMAVLATSREPLHLHAEQRYAVDPLQIPTDARPGAVSRAAAGRLFMERARGHDRRFELTDDNARAITDICRRLDGLPLAIELAAARTGLLGAEELSARLGQALDVLGSGPRDAPDRQRTLRATIEWSHRFLNRAEAEAFARFAVFAGGATIEAAQEVTEADLDALEGLVDKQLLRRRGPGRDTRLSMLETVREYALERLQEDGRAAEIHARHCLYYLDLAERAEPEMYTRGEAEWLARLDREIDNLRAALDWGLREDPRLALRLSGLLVWFWDIRNRIDEGLGWVEAAMAAAGNTAPVGERARALRAEVYLMGGKGAVYDWQGSLAHARARAVEALALSREAQEPAGIAEALLGLAHLEVAESLPQRRRRALAEEALEYAQEADDDRLVAFALRARALAVSMEEGASEIDAVVAAMRKIGSTRELVGFYSDAAYNAIKVGRPDRAAALLDEAMPLAHDLGEPMALAFVWGNAGLEALFNGDLDRAQQAFDEQLRLCREHAFWVASEGLSGLAALAARRGDPERAARLLGAATACGPWDADADVKSALEKGFLDDARRRHGDRRWERAFAGGAALSLDEAIDLALPPRLDL
jgi:predicted ATPase/DNA-binding SARP family transcriptional activator